MLMPMKFKSLAAQLKTLLLILSAPLLIYAIRNWPKNYYAIAPNLLPARTGIVIAVYDFLLIIIAAVLGLLAHLSRNRYWLAWILRTVIFTAGLCEFSWLFAASLGANGFTDSYPPAITILTILFPMTWLLLFMPIRELASGLFTSLDLIITGQVLVPLIRKKVKAADYFAKKKIFIPSSFPHLIALFILITASAYLFISINLPRLQIASLSLSIPLTIEPLSYGAIVLIILSFCGIGVYVSRSFKEALPRLALFKIGKIQLSLAIILIFVSYAHDALWAIYTHRLIGQDLATELSYYTPSSFTIAGSFLPSVIAALIITIVAAISEETLIRGALQPVFGILPSAIFHGLLHAQFAHTPAFIIKVAIWSTFIGLIKRYTNTTTAIVAHAGFNVVTILLFSLNP